MQILEARRRCGMSRRWVGGMNGRHPLQDVRLYNVPMPLNRGGSHGSSCVGKRGNKIKRSSWRALTDRFCAESKEQEAVECRVSCIDFVLVTLLPV